MRISRRLPGRHRPEKLLLRMLAARPPLFAVSVLKRITLDRPGTQRSTTV